VEEDDKRAAAGQASAAFSPAATAERFCAAAHSSSGASAPLRLQPSQRSHACDGPQSKPAQLPQPLSAGARSKKRLVGRAPPPHQHASDPLASSTISSVAASTEQINRCKSEPSFFTPRARGPSISEVGGEPLEGQIFNIFTLRDGRIVRIDDYRRRGEALAAAGVAADVGWKNRPVSWRRERSVNPAKPVVVLRGRAEEQT